jgi:diaminopimelate decarboxylase
LSPSLLAATQRAAEEHATPFYLTDLAQLSAAAESIERAFPDPWVRSYSLKADPLPALVGLLAARGWGGNCVSLGEIAAARAAGLRNDQITIEGIGKGPDEFDAAISASARGDALRWLAVESVDEARELSTRAQAAGLTAERSIKILLRCNPAIEPGTHSGLAVGRGSSKFGMDAAELTAAATAIAASNGALELIGIHLHAGSQLRNMNEWRTAVERSLRAYAALVDAGLISQRAHADYGTLCVGGGFPVDLVSDDEPATGALAFRAAADAAWSSANGPLPAIRAIEPGRALVAAATLLVTRVLHVRARTETVLGALAFDGAGPSICERQVILDAGMGELMRPALYGARHPVTALLRDQVSEAGVTLSAVHGPICESTDALGAHELPTQISRGELLLIHGAGAYADAMWSPYNGRPRPARILVNTKGELRTLRERQGS